MKALIYTVIAMLISIEGHSENIRVYADISGDLFHAGHIEFLKKARELGDELVVGVLSDEDISSYKRNPVLTLDERVTVIGACRLVDEVISAPPLCVSKNWLEENSIDVVVHGDDFDPTSEIAKAQYGPAIEMGIFVTVPYTSGISTTDIINRIKDRIRNEP